MPKRKRTAAERRLASEGGRPSSDPVRYLQVCHQELLQQRALLDQKVQALENAINAIGGFTPVKRGPGPGRPPRRGPGRPPGGAPRPGSLKDYIARVLSEGGIMAVKDIAAGVLRAGYKTKNKTLAKSVGIALAEMKTVRKVGRGRFRLK